LILVVSGNVDSCRDDATFPSDGRRISGNVINTATVDNVSDGFCGSEINTPGVWFSYDGTGNKIRVSSCDKDTKVLVKYSIFTGSCNDLQCIGGGMQPDYECSFSNGGDTFDTFGTAIEFETEVGQVYYVLVQTLEVDFTPSLLWVTARAELYDKVEYLSIPANDRCIDAVGPVPRDETLIDGTSRDASLALDQPTAGFCVDNQGLFPGVWYFIMGTGGQVTVSACSEFNSVGFSLSVYNGASCDDLTCVTGTYELAPDDAKCTFGPGLVKQSLSTFTFDTTDRDRYYILVHSKNTIEAPTTFDFRFYVNDGRDGKAGSSGASAIEFETGLPAGSGNGSGNGSGSGSGNGVDPSASVSLHSSSMKNLAVLCGVAGIVVGMWM
jgi:hypothetical protein